MHNQRWLVVANAESADIDLIQQFVPSYKLLVCDGAYDHLLLAAINVDVLLGDFDSIAADLLAQARQQDNLIVVEAPDQNKTDLQKAIEYIDTLSPTEIIVTNMLAGRADQTLYNLRLLRAYHADHRLLFYCSRNEKVLFYRDRCLTIGGPIGARVSILGFPHAELTSTGLVYDVQHCPLGFDGHDSVSNALRLTKAQLQIQGEVILIVDAAIEEMTYCR